MAGLTTTGLTIETIEGILASMVADQIANIDANLNTEADSLLGQLNAVYAAALFELWELFEVIYQSGYPDTASGQSLTWLAALTGTIRNVATASTVTVRFTGTTGTAIPAGTIVSPVDRPDHKYSTTVAAVTVLGTADVACEAVTLGSAPYIVSAESLTMPNPPPGISVSAAIEDSLVGLDEELDADLRTRREAELARPGSSTVDAIRSDLLQVKGVNVCQVYENATGVTDGNGLPPYSIECLVYSNASPAYVGTEVAQAIWDAKPAGTQTYGSLSNVATDVAGDTHTMYYSEPTEVPVYILVTLDYDPATYIGDALVKTAIKAWAEDNLTMGDDVVASDIVALVSGLAGVEAVDGANTGAGSTTVASGNPSLTITLRQVGTFDTANIDVTSTAV